MERSKRLTRTIKISAYLASIGYTLVWFYVRGLPVGVEDFLDCLLALMPGATCVAVMASLVGLGLRSSGFDRGHYLVMSASLASVPFALLILPADRQQLALMVGFLLVWITFFTFVFVAFYVRRRLSEAEAGDSAQD